VTGCEFYRRDFNRPNLNYHVVPKSANAKKSIDEIADWIHENNLRHMAISGRSSKTASGIVYTFSKKESEKVAQQLSLRNIRARFYHGDLDATAVRMFELLIFVVLTQLRNSDPASMSSGPVGTYKSS
jgi:bloom syndrome protein